MNASKKTTWAKALGTFFAPIILVLVFRWVLFEPYVIPSGSMVPTLMIHDHILVNKWAFGFRWPFTEKWLGFWRYPSRGEIVVFRYPLSVDTFFVKRIVAVEGDSIEVKEGQLIINGEPIPRETYSEKNISKELLSLSEREYDYYRENLNGHPFISRSFRSEPRAAGIQMKVPAGHFFVVGDNRDESNDSRFWGFVPYINLIGSAGWIWLSCESTLSAAPFLCDPARIRWDRIFKVID